MNPLDYIYFHDRHDYPGGDNGFAVPIAKCSEGTIFATFYGGQIESVPLSQMTSVDTGLGFRPIWKKKDPDNEWPGGHWPMIACYPCEVPTLPVYRPRTTLLSHFNCVMIDARLELHESVTYVDGKHFPSISWEVLDFLPFVYADQRSFDGSIANSGDSSVPRFVQDKDGNLAFIGQEVYFGGGGTFAPVYLRMLERAKAQERTVSWNEMDVYDLQRPWRNFRHPEQPPPPILTPADRPDGGEVPESPTTPPEPEEPVTVNWNGTREGEAKLYDGDINTKGLTFGDMRTRGVFLKADPDTPESRGPIVQLAELRILEDRLELVVANDTCRVPHRNPRYVEYNGKRWENDGWPTEHGAVITLPFDASPPVQPELTIEERVKRLEQAVFG